MGQSCELRVAAAKRKEVRQVDVSDEVEDASDDR